MKSNRKIQSKIPPEYIEISKNIIYISSLVSSVIILIASMLAYYFNPISYIGFPYLSGHSEAIFIWFLYGLLYLRRKVTYKFLIFMIPLFGLSDLLWNISADIQYGINLILSAYGTTSFFNYLIYLPCIIALIIIIFKPKLQRPNKYQLISFVLFYLIYVFILHVPVVEPPTLQIFPSNIYWEMVWQIAFLLTFGNIFKSDKEKPKVEQLIPPQMGFS